jgi:hypothetical protein
VLLGQGHELELGEERMRGRAVGRPPPHRLQVQRHRHVRAQGDQALGQDRVLGVRLQPFAVGVALDLVRVRDHVLHRPEFAHEVAGALLADAGHPGHVVHRVPHQRQHVDHAVGRHAELLLHRPAVVHHRARSLAPGVQHEDVVRDELEQVLVAGDDDHLVAARHRLGGEGRDHVVGLEAGRVEDGQAEDVAHAAHVGQLHREVVVHLAAVRLVLRVLLVAEGLAGQVEGNGGELRVLVLVQLLEHGGEAVGRVGGQAARGGEALDGEVRAVELRAAVDQVDGVGAAGHPRIL